ncbi:hypothetical protein VTJ04DRAFT_4568 [Mycothermus thermophilus]|uniref:uncharacterized protein n=1 Tax=Humicola insolens TaxID=85995 RepID=UPI003742F618
MSDTPGAASPITWATSTTTLVPTPDASSAPKPSRSLVLRPLLAIAAPLSLIFFGPAAFVLILATGAALSVVEWGVNNLPEFPPVRAPRRPAIGSGPGPSPEPGPGFGPHAPAVAVAGSATGTFPFAENAVEIAGSRSASDAAAAAEAARAADPVTFHLTLGHLHGAAFVVLMLLSTTGAWVYRLAGPAFKTIWFLGKFVWRVGRVVILGATITSFVAVLGPVVIPSLAIISAVLGTVVFCAAIGWWCFGIVPPGARYLDMFVKDLTDRLVEYPGGVQVWAWLPAQPDPREEASVMWMVDTPFRRRVSLVFVLAEALLLSCPVDVVRRQVVEPVVALMRSVASFLRPRVPERLKRLLMALGPGASWGAVRIYLFVPGGANPAHLNLDPENFQAWFRCHAFAVPLPRVLTPWLRTVTLMGMGETDRMRAVVWTGLVSTAIHLSKNYYKACAPVVYRVAGYKGLLAMVKIMMFIIRALHATFWSSKWLFYTFKALPSLPGRLIDGIHNFPNTCIRIAQDLPPKLISLAREKVTSATLSVFAITWLTIRPSADSASSRFTDLRNPLDDIPYRVTPRPNYGLAYRSQAVRILRKRVEQEKHWERERRWSRRVYMGFRAGVSTNPALNPNYPNVLTNELSVCLEEVRRMQQTEEWLRQAEEALGLALLEEALLRGSPVERAVLTAEG